MNKTITVIVPCYNEEKIIYNNIIKLNKGLKKTNRKIKLVLLNDGSTDNTKSEIDRLYKKVDFKYFEYDFPSRRENLLHCIDNFIKTKYLMFLDCDMATDLKDLKPLFNNLKYYDIVSGSRYLTSSKVERNTIRRIISFIFNNSIRLLFGSKIRDHECGFKAFDTKKLKKIIKITKYGDLVSSRKMFWDTEMWITAQRLGYKILEIPIAWKAGDKSALRFKTEISMLSYILKYFINSKIKKVKK